MTVPQGVWEHWEADPLELTLIMLPAVWYALGVRASWRSAGVGHGVSRRQCVAFAGAIIALLVALASPIDAAAEELFSAHMLQHLLLILVAAPLWAAGAPLLPMLWALPASLRRRVAQEWRGRAAVRVAAGMVTSPGVAFTLHTVALWFWHFPGPYQAALARPAVHALEHLSFFGTAVLFWWVILEPFGRRRTNHAVGLLLIAATLMQSGALGAVLMFAREPWYPAHAAGTAEWGTTLLADQQLAGLLMWVPASFVYIGAAARLFVTWMREDEARDRRLMSWAAVPAAVPPLEVAE